MYKDVWKKFGAKVLIVLCSVLLLGGVAVAAPRLRAADIQGPVSIASCSALDIEVVGMITYQEDGKTPLPTSLIIKIGSDTMTISEDDDFTIKGSGNTQAAAKKDDGDKAPWIEIEGVAGGKLEPATEGGFPVTRKVRYTIEKKAVNSSCFTHKMADADTVTTRTNPLVVKSVPTNIVSTNFSVYYTNAKDNITNRLLTEGTDYTLDSTSTEVKNLGTGQSFSIELKNYKMISDDSSKKSFDCWAVKDVGELEVLINDYKWEKYQPASEDEPIVVTVYDGDVTYDADGKMTAVGTETKKLTADTDYSIDYQAAEQKYVIGSTSTGNYIGTRNITYTKKGALFNPVGMFDKTVYDYDDDLGGTYEYEPSTVSNREYDASDNETLRTLAKGTDYRIAGYSVKGGGTAGTVTITYEGLGKYVGQTATNTYQVKRNLAKVTAIKDLHLEAVKEGDDFIYDRTEHKMTPLLTLTGSDYQLKETTDFKVSYNLGEPATSQIEPVKDEDHYTFAGTVYVTIEGNIKKDANIGGYYGNLTGGNYESAGSWAFSGLSYKIERRDINDGYAIELREDTFNLTFSEPPVEEKALLVAKTGGGPIPVKSLGEAYDVSFEDASGNEVEWSSAQAGTYYIVFTFHGNFKNSVKAAFTLLNVIPKDVKVQIDGKCTGDASIDDVHTYTGEAHVPKVTATYMGNPLSGFTVSYSRDKVTYSENPEDYNVDAGKVYVKLTLQGGLEVAGENRYFEIAKRSLDKGTLRLSSDDDFKRSSSVVTHEYAGRVSAPEVTKLTLEIEDASGSVEREIPMAAGTDFTLASGLYTAQSNTKFNLENQKQKEDYCFRISGTGNNFTYPSGKKIDTENFQITARDINNENSIEIAYAINPIDYVEGTSDADYAQTILDTLVITDAKFKDGSGAPSVLRKEGTYKDYEIAFKENLISTNGTVAFTITGTGGGTDTGCYKGAAVYELNVGKDIVNASVREKSNKTHKYFNLGSRSLILSENYTQEGKTYNLKFNDTKVLDTSMVNVYYTISGSDKIIPYGGENAPADTDKNYLAYFEDPYFNASGQQYGVVRLQGVNGYYGEVTIEFPIQKINLEKEKYFITFLGQEDSHEGASVFIYTGEEIEPDIQVWAKGQDPENDTSYLEEGVDYRIIEYGRQIEANEQYWDIKYQTRYWSYVEIEGLRGYEGKIRGYYKIERRNISMVDPDDSALDIIATGFRLDNWKDPMDYRPNTDTSVQGQHLGAWQDVKLYFKPSSSSPEKELAGGTDYSYECKNTKNAGKATCTVKGKGNNFTGEFTQEYVISPVKLSDTSKCTVTLAEGNNWRPFTGKEVKPTVIVKQTVEGKEYTLTEGVDYAVDYQNALFVSKSSDLTSTNATYAIAMEIKKDKDGKEIENPNYLDSVELPYVIYGNINATEPSMYGWGVSRLMANSGNDVIIPYAEPMAYERLNLVLQQHKEGCDYGDGNGDSDEYPMEWKTDYTVTCSDETIGYHTVLVSGTGNRTNLGAIIGDKRVPITIQASLSADIVQDVLWQKNGGSNNISSVKTLTKEALAELLTIQCGGRKLTYGEDYEFENDVKTELGGPYYITVKPTDKANKNNNGAGEPNSGYLTGKQDIEYYISSDIQGSATITNLEKKYIYAHGVPVFEPLTHDFGVLMNGKPLNNRRDYTVSIIDKKGEVCDKPIDCGTYNLTVTGIGDYSGMVSTVFEIVPYDFEADYAKDKVFITFVSETMTYTGKEVLPAVKEVTVKSGGSFTLAPFNKEDGTGDYSTKAGSQGDHINWTDTAAGDKAPTVIVKGENNYIGEISGEYYITQKTISDADILAADIEGLFYDNGKPVVPYPELTYYKDVGAGLIYKALNGIKYNSADASEGKYGDNWKEYAKADFTYQYLDDVTSIGNKTIEIRGMGNFTGSTKVYYTVSPLDLGITKINFLSDEWPVYDGTELKPSFELKYNDVTVLTCMNGEVLSEHGLNNTNVSVTFGNNVNATTDDNRATIRIQTTGENSNYTGALDAYFTIMPAPLNDHVKFIYRVKGQKGTVNLSSYKLNLPWVDENTTVQPVYSEKVASAEDLEEEQIGIFYDYAGKANNNMFLELLGKRTEEPTGDYEISYKYVEPDSEDVDVRKGYGNEHEPPCSYAGKVKVTLTGKGNYTGEARFWYYIGKDISALGTARLKTDKTVFNSQVQTPVVILSGITKEECDFGYYKGETKLENLINENDFVHAGTYYVRIEGIPWKGTYASKPQTFTYTITARPLSSAIVIDGFKKEYSYTGNPICPIGISVTDYIDKIKYRLTEDVDYSLTYANNLNAGTAVITVVGQNDYSGTATAKFTITSSTISSGGVNNGGPLTNGTGELSGTVAVKPDDVKLTMDTSDAMYYTGSAVRPGVSIAGMTENVDYTVTFSNNVNVGTGTVTITGIKNNTGTITKTFRIIASLTKCTVAPIPDQQHTGSAVTPTITVMCGSTILVEGSDYTVSYANNVNIGTATVTIRAASNSNYTGYTTAKFHIGNNIGAFIISGYASSYTYTGKAITPGVVVESGNSTLTQGVDYTVSYANNTNAGTATITVTGIGKYSGTQTANFIIEGKSIESCDTSTVSDKTYTGDAYTPSITVSDSGTVLVNGVDYIVTYANNTNPGTASILVQGLNSNYIGTKVISFKIAGVAITGLKASSVSYNSIKLAWTKQSYASGYQICDSKSKVVKTVTKNSASATISKLSAGKTYKYKVRSYIRNSDGSKSYGAFSTVLSTTTKLKTPSVKITSTQKGQARISWSKVSGATGYELYYKKSKSASYKKIKTINNANTRICTVRGLNSGDRCYFRVRAFKKSGSKKIYSALNPLKVITIK